MPDSFDLAICGAGPAGAARFCVSCSMTSIGSEPCGKFSAREPHPVPYRALWVDVNQQRLATAPCEGTGKVDRRGRLAHSPLLADDGKDGAH